MVVAYEQGKFGNLTSEEQEQGKTRKWKFSIREIQRVIQDFYGIEQ